MVVIALFASTYAVANPFAAFGVFLPVLAETFGWSRGSISLAMSMNLLLGSFFSLAIGTLTDRHGPRLPLTITVGLSAAGFALAARVETLWQLYLFVGVVAGVGMSSFYVVSTATVARWFVARRGLALGLVLTGFNLGVMTGGPVAAFLIEWLGWRSAFLVFGVSCAAVGVVASAVVSFPPGTLDPSTGSRWSGFRPLLGDWRLWALAFSWFLTGFVMLMLTVHVVPFARDQGIRLESAAFGLTAYGLGAVIGRVAGGAASDRLGTMSLMWAFYGLKVVALAPLVLHPSQSVVLVVLLLFGIGFAGADTVFARAVPEVFGLHVIGAVFGFLALGWRWGAALGPATAGFVYDATGSYAIPFGVAPLAVIVSFVLFRAAARKRPAP